MTQRREFLTVLTATSALFAGGRERAEAEPVVKGGREAVLGFGGFFFRVHDPKAMGEGYREHLGIPVSPVVRG